MYFIQILLFAVAKQLLAVGYGRFSGFEKAKLSLEQIERKVELCKQVLNLINLLENGIATQIGMSIQFKTLLLKNNNIVWKVY